MLVVLVVAPLAACHALEDGYQRRHVESGAPVAGAVAVAGAYTVYYSNDAEPDYLPEKIYRFDILSRASALAADGLGSIAAMVYDTDAAVLYVADNAIGAGGVGDTVLKLQDGNADGDFLDDGEIMEYAPTGSIPFISGLDRGPDGRIYAANADSNQGDIYVVQDVNGDGDALDAGEVAVFCAGAQSLYLAGVAVRSNPLPEPVTEIYYNDAAGEVFRLIDTNGDGDANDPGERTLFASGLSGGYDLMFDAEGDCYVTAGTEVWQLRPDGDDPDDLTDSATVFDDLSTVAGFLMGIGLNLPELPFEPWTVPGAQVLVAYLDLMYSNPTGMFLLEAESPPTATPTAEATATPTVEATATPTAEATDTPAPEPSATPSPVATNSPTALPSVPPTWPATATPLPTATPELELGVTLMMPGVEFHPGDPCWLTAEVCNPGAAAGSAPMAVLLDIGTGDYWFWPSWSQYPPAIDIGAVDLAHGCQQVEIIPEFAWPPDTGGATGLTFYGALLTEDLTALLGALGQWEFGYGD